MAASSSGRFGVSPRPVLDISATDSRGNAVIGKVLDATRLNSGEIVIADGGDASIRIFGANGQLLRQSGRVGDGPGEFRNPTWLERCLGDSLFVWDPFTARVSVLAPDGHYVRQFHLRWRAGQMSCSSQGTLVLILLPPNPGMMSGKSDVYTSSVVISNSRGDSLGGIASIRLGENRPMATITRIAMGKDRFYVGAVDSAAALTYDLTGHLLGSIRVGTFNRTPTQHHYDAAVDQLVSVLKVGSERDVIRERMLRIPMPDHLPPYSAFFVDPLGVFWAVISAPGDGDTRLAAVSDGRMLGGVRFPLEMQVFEIGREYILGMYEGEDGNQHVAVYQLHRH